MREIDWLEEIHRDVSETTFQRGRQYFEQGRVKQLSVADLDEGNKSRQVMIISASVKGSGRNMYKQKVGLLEDSGAGAIAGNCSCPVGFNCKHVVAVLFAFQQGMETKVEQTAQPNDASLRWLDELDDSERDGDLVVDEKFIAYVLNADKAGHAQLEVFKTRFKKDGTGLIKGNHYYLDDLAERLEYRYSDDVQVMPVDIEIAQSLAAQIGYSGYYRSEATLKGFLGYRALMLALETGRLFWKSHQTGKRLGQGAPRPLNLSWEEEAGKGFKLQVALQPEAGFILTDPPLYVDGDRGELGEIEQNSFSAKQLEKLLKAPQVPEQVADEFSKRLLVEHPHLTLPPPKPLDIDEIKDAPLTPQLHIFAERGKEGLLHAMRMRFEYAGLEVSALDFEPVSVITQGDKVLRVFRDEDAEYKAISRLEDYGFSYVRLDARPDLFCVVARQSMLERAEVWNSFMENTVPELEQDGWRISVDDSFQLQFEEVEHWDAQIEQSDNDWFDMRFDITVNGQSMPLLPLITPLLEHFDLENLPETVTIPLDEQRFIRLPSAQLKPFLEILLELFDSIQFDDDGVGKISRYNAAALADMEEHCYGLFSLQGADELIETGRKLKNFNGIQPVPPSPNLNAELRPYQQTGLNWLQFLREYRFAGILADDMGLGKTVQTLAHLQLEKASGRMQKPCLIVAPTSLMSNWRHEAERFTPDLKVLILQGAERKQKFKDIESHDLVLTTYPLLPRDEAVLLEHEYYYLILDEAHIIKNPKAQASRIVRKIQSEHRLSLTGTPMENHLGELWAQFDFLLPGFLGNQTDFTRLYRTPIEKHGDAVKRERLAKRVKPFMLRRTKQEVVDELPEKTEIVRSVPLYDKQAALYESIRIAMEEKVRKAIAEKGLARSHIMILDALLKLRQTCCDPRILSLKQAQKIHQSAKLDLLLEMLDEMLDEGRRVLVFSQFTKMLAVIEKQLKAKKIGYTKLTGQTRKRDEAIEQFKNGSVDVFLISLKAGGVGLNLTEADTVIIYDPWWNPAVESQAADRVYRIGQDKAVFVYKLITENTVEEKILALQERKRALADGVYRQGKSGDKFELTTEDLNELFQPVSKE